MQVDVALDAAGPLWPAPDFVRRLVGMSEPAPELSVEELSQHPDMLGEALDTLTHGRPVRLVGPDRRQLADIVPIGLVEELEETVAVLSDSAAVRALLEAREAAARGDVVRGVDAVRALLDERA